MIIPDQKKLTTVILSKLKPSGESMNTEMKNEKNDSPLHAISQDLIQALDSKSAEGVSEALRAAFDFLEQGEDSEEDSSQND